MAKGSHEWTAVDCDPDGQGEVDFGDNVGLQQHCSRLISDEFASRAADAFIPLDVHGDDSAIQPRPWPNTSGLDVGAVCQPPPDPMAHSFTVP